jgi:catechol 2,3-dioxygenase-like lactoylglutathione lyase family enzyme
MNNVQPFKLDRLHHIQLSIPTGGEADSRTFWGEALGMIELVKPPALAARGGCWFRAGSLEIHLGVEKDFAPAGKAHPAILVTDLVEFAKHLEAQGISVAWDENFPGFNRFYAHDPFGNRLEFLEQK